MVWHLFETKHLLEEIRYSASALAVSNTKSLNRRLLEEIRYSASALAVFNTKSLHLSHDVFSSH